MSNTDRTTGRRDATDSAANVADEAVKLMEALGAWAGTASGEAPGAGSREHDPSGERSCSCTDSAPAVCKVCPVCRVGAFLEELSPDVMERVADLIAMVAGSLHAAAETRRSGQRADQPSDRQSDMEDTERRSSGRSSSPTSSPPGSRRRVPMSADPLDEHGDGERPDSAE